MSGRRIQLESRLGELGQIIVAVRQMDTVMCMMIVGFELLRTTVLSRVIE